MSDPEARSLAVLAALTLAACSTAGSAWMNEPVSPRDAEKAARRSGGSERPPVDPERFRTRVIGGDAQPASAPPASVAEGQGSVSFGASKGPPRRLDGRVLGTFRNTYYDFPSAAEFSGEPVPLKDARCEPISQVPRAFFEALCVQGSGILESGRPVSFAKRDCECAEVCPRTGQKICFEALDPSRFPWGRGARGLPITPLLTVAVDDAVVPLGTPIYVPELEGLPLDAARSAVHDGCFLAEDRGLRVKGQHVDVFTGSTEMTKLWNRLVPSNRGVTVVLDSPRCARADVAEATRALGEGAAKPVKKPRRAAK